MALELGINSYISLEDAILYFENRLDVAAWIAADSVMREQALVMATSALEEMRWKGRVRDSAQPLCWPRVGVFYDQSRGEHVSFDTNIPPQIPKACCEIAYHYLNNDGLFDETGQTTNLKIDVISLERIQAPNKLPMIARRLIKMYLINGASAWWRAN